MSRRNSTSSNASTKSLCSNITLCSVLSDDSYVELLQTGVDDVFRDMLASQTLPESQDTTIMMERKIQSHNVKKRDPQDVARRGWSDEMESDHKVYKAKVDDLVKASQIFKASRKAIKPSKMESFAAYERACITAVNDGEEWARFAIEAGAARLEFLKKYPDAFDTEEHRTHIGQAQCNLNSAKAAYRECQKFQQLKL